MNKICKIKRPIYDIYRENKRLRAKKKFDAFSIFDNIYHYKSEGTSFTGPYLYFKITNESFYTKQLGCDEYTYHELKYGKQKYEKCERMNKKTCSKDKFDTRDIKILKEQYKSYIENGDDYQNFHNKYIENKYTRIDQCIIKHYLLCYYILKVKKELIIKQIARVCPTLFQDYVSIALDYSGEKKDVIPETYIEIDDNYLLKFNFCKQFIITEKDYKNKYYILTPNSEYNSRDIRINNYIIKKAAVNDIELHGYTFYNSNKYWFKGTRKIRRIFLALIYYYYRGQNIQLHWYIRAEIFSKDLQLFFKRMKESLWHKRSKRDIKLSF